VVPRFGMQLLHGKLFAVAQQMNGAGMVQHESLKQGEVEFLHPGTLSQRDGVVAAVRREDVGYSLPCQHPRCMEILWNKAAVEMEDHSGADFPQRF